jgi:hypothetical protein
MLSNVLKSARAVEVSILIIEAFVRLRSAIAWAAGRGQRCISGKLGTDGRLPHEPSLSQTEGTI